MPNKENLIPGAHRLTIEEQSMGGKASGEVRRQKATLRKALQAVLNDTFTDSNGNQATGAEVLLASMFKIASNTRDRNAVNAFKALLELSGEAKALEDPAAEELSKLDELLEAVHNDAVQR